MHYYSFNLQVDTRLFKSNYNSKTVSSQKIEFKLFKKKKKYR